jgi:HlyD family secretion protein
MSDIFTKDMQDKLITWANVATARALEIKAAIISQLQISANLVNSKMLGIGCAAAIGLLVIAFAVLVQRRRRKKIRTANIQDRGAPIAAEATPIRQYGKVKEPEAHLRRHMLIGFSLTFLLVVGLGGWAATTSLSGAVLASGTVVVESNVKKVQHPTGGIVGELKVKDGDHVEVGQLLIRLDETVTRANLLVVTQQLDELGMQISRLKAERDGADVVLTPKDFVPRQDDPDIREIIEGEQKLFENRRNARAGQKAQFSQRIVQLRSELEGLTQQKDAKSHEIELEKLELAGEKALWDKNLMPISKYTASQRDATRLEGDRGLLTAQTAQTNGKITETELQILQIDADFRSEVMKDLRDTQSKWAELIERKVAAEDQLKRVEIRSPQAGLVHQLSVHTVGGVITPSEQIMLIVPEGDKLVIEVKIMPQDIDNVRQGQTAFIRFPAFNQRTTPEFNGVVELVSADLTKEPQSNQSYFVARVVLSDVEVKKLGVLKLVPGMPAEVHIRTTERTALSYMIKPLHDQIAKAFKEP